jgi:peptide/nickel transport system ATP-binding protein
MTDAPLVEVEDLRIAFRTERGPVEAVRGISFAVGRERLGIVGESGSGKSLTARALLGLAPPAAAVSARRLAFDGKDLRGAGEAEWRALRGRRIGMVLQDPKFALNPVMRVGAQIGEALRTHAEISARAARARVLEMLEAVKIRDPGRVYRSYPHELSGGMGQRAMIAMMLIAGPDLLIADEPTSALDVTVQQQVLEILDDLVARRGMALVFISHDLPLVASFCDRVLVMRRGEIVESCAAAELHRAAHPYTRALLAAVPRLDGIP